VDLRRALLLFAIVLGLAAIASSIARPPEDDDKRDARVPATESSGRVEATSVPDASAGERTIRLRPGIKKKSWRLIARRPATLIVAVAEPGQVEIPKLGLVQPAEPLTPARFDLLISTPDRIRVFLRAASGNGGRRPLGSIHVAPK
jgi:hypothetical protein